jgi:hypothetical protein
MSNAAPCRELALLDMGSRRPLPQSCMPCGSTELFAEWNSLCSVTLHYLSGPAPG